ncbi:hypothetical protein E6B08_23290 [Pseudomonas putida]|uniref:Uncharacterized protein n=1 Tax=Pseudomonas putida TaxID=303 RepID=A0A4D6XI26_PSEPU|nr:hypothetical protein [Pseudomonas putida]QCI14088.1 hypothetical protein E6B08_23290 [Pseudomonas putida]
MTAMSAQPTHSISFRVGYSVGTLVSACRRSLKDGATRELPSTDIPSAGLHMLCTRNDWDELSKTPTLARRGVDLNRWYEENTKEAKPDKPKRKRSSVRKAAPASTSFVGPLPKFGPLDQLIA